ncbi:hypothetical protein ACFYRN_41205 [Streptomyces sp. NPDC005227]|uniref:hypothetical protein n=1 Tax=Streptomyces sp. NPDC005227 TaxID=3364707 RepID=UPI00369340DE
MRIASFGQVSVIFFANRAMRHLSRPAVGDGNAHHHLKGLPDGTQWWPDASRAEGALTWLRQQHARTSLLLPASSNSSQS